MPPLWEQEGTERPGGEMKPRKWKPKPSHPKWKNHPLENRFYRVGMVKAEWKYLTTK